MRSVQTWLDEYGESHRNRSNKTIHWICVPLIYWSVYAALTAIPVPGFFAALPLNWGLLAFLLVQIYYFALSLRLGLGLLLFNIVVIGLTYWLGVNVSIPMWQLAAAVFVAAWIGQFIGHQIEGKRPSFFTDLQFLLIGPAWLKACVYRRFKLSY